MQSIPQISVIIPVYNSAAELARCLNALKQNELIGECEILVIDDGSDRRSDEIEAAAREHQARYYRQENAGPGVARNFGAKLARGGILAFIDADCLAPPEWISRLTRPLRENACAAVTSCYSDPVTPGWLTVFQNEDYWYRMPSRECDTDFVNSCNFAVKRDVFESCKGFPEQRVSEDMVLGMKLTENGTPARYLPAAGVQHDYHQTLTGYLMQRFSFAYHTIRSFLDRNSSSPSRPNPQVRSFNPLRTILGAMFGFAGTFLLTTAGLMAVFNPELAGYLLPAALNSLALEIAVHGKFWWHLAKRRGFRRALTYLPLIYLIDMTYALAMGKGVIAAMGKVTGRSE